MREIKFRAWDKTRKQMLDVWKVDCGTFPKPSELYNRDFDPLFDKNNSILMQYTGLKDKNGKEIYEGDIILDHGYQGIVKYGSIKRLGFHGVFYLDLSAGGGTGGDVMFDKILDCAIIGNIHENPELVKP